MPSRKTIQQLRRKLDQQKRLGDRLRLADEDLYRFVYEACEAEGVSTYGIAAALGVPTRTVQGWYAKGKRLSG